jgi:UDP-N-acetylglucosamine--N-acetylmuramyl-(pentapeptide) pyrophosphoryl-undecaprenol N-acetylglucosamine transferase
MNKKLKVILSGGGTGGHIFPAIAIADEIKKDFLMLNFCSLEPTEKWKWKKFRRLAIKLKELILPESTEEILSNLGLPFKILKSLSRSKKIIKNFAPDFAVGTGGFASGPAFMKRAKWEFRFLFRNRMLMQE